MTDQAERKGTTTEGGSASRNAASHTIHHEQGGETTHSVMFICQIRLCQIMHLQSKDTEEQSSAPLLCMCIK